MCPSYDNLPPNKGSDIWCGFISILAARNAGTTHAWSGYIVVQLFVIRNG